LALLKRATVRMRDILKLLIFRFESHNETTSTLCFFVFYCAPSVYLFLSFFLFFSVTSALRLRLNFSQ